jgi:hypothetical protein
MRFIASLQPRGAGLAVPVIVRGRRVPALRARGSSLRAAHPPDRRLAAAGSGRRRSHGRSRGGLGVGRSPARSACLYSASPGLRGQLGASQEKSSRRRSIAALTRAAIAPQRSSRHANRPAKLFWLGVGTLSRASAKKESRRHALKSGAQRRVEGTAEQPARKATTDCGRYPDPHHIQWSGSLLIATRGRC